MYTWLEPGRLFMDYGPIQLTLSAYREGTPLQKEMEKACQYLADQLGVLAPFLPVAKRPYREVKALERLPKILQNMHQAIAQVGAEELTSMAAVAGSFSDAAADYLVACGATKVMVNNGGDVALRLAAGEETTLGIVSDIHEKTISHTMRIHGASGIGGVATSGFGGRSLTRGIASAAVVFAANCRQADAAATYIANQTFAPDPAIVQVPAQTLVPDTDIPHLLVTVSVGKLPRHVANQAMQRGLDTVKTLVQQETIQGAALFIKQDGSFYPRELAERITPKKMEIRSADHDRTKTRNP